jgi:transcriptional regulator with XRE-family HTH domain
VSENQQRRDPRLATEVDVAVGRRIRSRREELGLTLDQVAQQLDISAAQLLKYERAESRVPAARLPVLASVFAVPITYFYDPNKQGAEDPAIGISQAIEMLGAFRMLQSDMDRRRAIDMVRVLAGRSVNLSAE